MYKVISEIADCSMGYKLLYFHYDLWLWLTVTGAIAAGWKMKCSPDRALETKPFSSEFLAFETIYPIRYQPNRFCRAKGHFCFILNAIWDIGRIDVSRHKPNRIRPLLKSMG